MNMLKTLAVLCLFGIAFAEFTASISMSSCEYNGESLLVDWELESNNIFSDRILSWNTPLEFEWNSNMFNIVHDKTGERAIYMGKLMKRAIPEIENFEAITSEESLKGCIDLSEGYNFPYAGDYSVTLNFRVHLLSGKTFVVASNTLKITVVEPDVMPSQDTIFVHSRAVGYTDCSVSETNTVKAAIPNALSASSNTLNYMNQIVRTCTTSFETWFGNYTSSRWNTIQSDFQAIYDRFDSNGFNIDCGCKQPGTYAYVYPSDPTHTIHLCPVFWDASDDPYHYNSQPGTLTHEMSHFSDVAGTDDIQYGVPGCYELAQTNPNQAVKNADSHEFLQESDPNTSSC